MQFKTIFYAHIKLYKNISPSVLLSLGSVVSTFSEMYTFVFNYVQILVQL